MEQRNSHDGKVEQRWCNSQTSDGGTVQHLMVESAISNGGTVEQMWWKSRTSNGGTMEQLMVKQWKEVEEQWNKDAGTVGHLMANSGTEVVEP